MPGNEDSEEEGDGGVYQVLRPRNVPRRHLRGNMVVDQYLDHSDSFREMVPDEEEAPDKEVHVEPFVSD